MIGSRGSKLALWQAHHVAEQFKGIGSGIEAEILIVRTAGDKLQEADVRGIGKGAFTKELEESLLAGEIDLAVHSMKDVPTGMPAGLRITAILRRDEVRDCLVSREGARLEELKPGSLVGTSSLRRQAQLRYFRPDVEFRDMRGNVDSRLGKVEEGEYDAAIFAKAGLDRLELGARATEIFSPERILPAAGQGALGIETRAEDEDVNKLVALLDDAETSACVAAERALLEEIGGGCVTPVGVFARLEMRELVLDAGVFSMDGKESVRRRGRGALGSEKLVGRRVGQELLEGGAGRLLRLARDGGDEERIP
jgi:hydroxymethylbilane synthase